jgi:hypothetical protein
MATAVIAGVLGLLLCLCGCASKYSDYFRPSETLVSVAQNDLREGFFPEECRPLSTFGDSLIVCVGVKGLTNTGTVAATVEISVHMKNLSDRVLSLLLSSSRLVVLGVYVEPEGYAHTIEDVHPGAEGDIHLHFTVSKTVLDKANTFKFVWADCEDKPHEWEFTRMEWP